MAWSKEAAVKYAEENAESGSTGKCAKYVKNALVQGGLTYLGCVHARNCGGGLEAQGFAMVMDQATDIGVYEVGDVVVIEGWADPDGEEGPKKGNASGHLALWNGKVWISDFVQTKSVYPGPGYRENKPAYKIYRNAVQ